MRSLKEALKTQRCNKNRRKRAPEKTASHLITELGDACDGLKATAIWAKPALSCIQVKLELTFLVVIFSMAFVLEADYVISNMTKEYYLLLGLRL